MLLSRRLLSDIRSKTIPALTRAQDTLSISWPKTSSFETSNSIYHHIWLRDNCQCPQCVHPSTRQKLHSSAAIPITITPLDLNTTNDGVKIKWSDQHESNFSWEWLKQNCYDPESIARRLVGPLKQRPWKADDLKRLSIDFEYSKLEKNDQEELRGLVTTLQCYGLAYVNDVPTHLTQVETLAQMIGPIRETFYGRSWDVKSVVNAKNIAYTSLFLGLHMDLMYFESPPGLQFLHCLESTVKGGENLFMDVYKAAQMLRENNPEDFDILTKIPVTFHYKNDGHHMYYRHPTIDINTNNGEMHMYYAPPFQGPLEAQTEQVELFYKAFQKFSSYIEDPDMVYRRQLLPGQCVIFVNRRVLHGRAAFDSTTGTRHLRGTYVDWDCLKDKVRVLGQK